MLPKAWENSHAIDQARKNLSQIQNFNTENLFHPLHCGESWAHSAEIMQLTLTTVTLLMENEKWHASTERKIKPPSLWSAPRISFIDPKKLASRQKAWQGKAHATSPGILLLQRIIINKENRNKKDYLWPIVVTIWRLFSGLCDPVLSGLVSISQNPTPQMVLTGNLVGSLTREAKNWMSMETESPLIPRSGPFRSGLRHIGGAVWGKLALPLPVLYLFCG